MALRHCLGNWKMNLKKFLSHFSSFQECSRQLPISENISFQISSFHPQVLFPSKTISFRGYIYLFDAHPRPFFNGSTPGLSPSGLPLILPLACLYWIFVSESRFQVSSLTRLTRKNLSRLRSHWLNLTWNDSYQNLINLEDV